MGRSADGFVFVGGDHHVLGLQGVGGDVVNIGEGGEGGATCPCSCWATSSWATGCWRQCCWP